VFPRDLDGTTQWLHLRHKGSGNVGYEVLLHYRTSSQSLNEARNLGNAYDPSIGNIAEIYPATINEQMMRAQGEELDARNNNQFTVAGAEGF
jgi:hypothetical protein